MKSRTTITANQHVLVRLPLEGIKIVELKPGGLILLGKFGLFLVDGVLGYPLGQSFEILENHNVSAISSLTFEIGTDIVEGGDVSDEITKDELTAFFQNSSNDNQNIINIGSEVQKLTMDEIDELKKLGTSLDVGQKIIEKIIAGHGGFDKKTIFSQQKYLKRKQQKFLRRFTIEYLGSSQVLQYYTEKDAQRVLDMSEESLGLLLSYSNVRPGGRYLLIDETGGVVLYAMMERMQGKGTIVVAHDNEHPNHIALRYSDYPESMVTEMVKPINWLQFLEPQNEKIEWEDLSPEEFAALGASKRQQHERRTNRAQHINMVISEVEQANFDAVIVVSTLFYPTLVPHLVGKAGGLRPIVVYHQSKEPLLETQHLLQDDKRVLAPSIYETKVRPFQTIPGRMHPVMSMRGYGGFILWATRVFPLEGGVQAVGRGMTKKRKVEPEVEKKDEEKNEADKEKNEPEAVVSTA